MIDSVTESAGAAPDLKKARRRKAGFSEAASGVDRLPTTELLPLKFYVF